MINILNLNIYFMKLTKHILEAVHRGIQLALDDYQDIDPNSSISQTNDVIDVNDVIEDRIEFDKKYVNLGLPSGTIWAKFNLGADINWLDTAKDWYGDYYAWGETQTRLSFKDWKKYKWFEGFNKGELVYSKYIVSNRNIKFRGKTPDNLSQLLPEDDAAYIQTNGEMVIPTKDQYEELLKYTTQTYVQKYNNVNRLNGYIFRSKQNGKELFIPCAGYKANFDMGDRIGDLLITWASTPVKESTDAYCLYIGPSPEPHHISWLGRDKGLTIRPVKNMQNNQTAFDIEESILKYYEQYKNLTIQSQEIKRLNNKHILIDNKLLQQLLSKRVYNNIMAYLGRNVIPYSKFYEITQKYKLKLYGGKKFGYPEIDFSPEDPR